MTYCIRCSTCGFTTESTYRSMPDVPCPQCGEETLIRDYRSEAVAAGRGVRASRSPLGKFDPSKTLPRNWRP